MKSTITALWVALVLTVIPRQATALPWQLDQILSKPFTAKYHLIIPKRDGSVLVHLMQVEDASARQLLDAGTVTQAQVEAARKNWKAELSSDQNYDVTISSDGKRILYLETKNGEFSHVSIISDRTYNYEANDRVLIEPHTDLSGFRWWPYLPFGLPGLPGYLPPVFPKGFSPNMFHMQPNETCIGALLFGMRGSIDGSLIYEPSVFRWASNQKDLISMSCTYGSTAAFHGWRRFENVSFPEQVEVSRCDGSSPKQPSRRVTERRLFSLTSLSAGSLPIQAFNIRTYITDKTMIQDHYGAFRYNANVGAFETPLNRTLAPSSARPASTLDEVINASATVSLFGAAGVAVFLRFRKRATRARWQSNM